MHIPYVLLLCLEFCRTHLALYSAADFLFVCFKGIDIFWEAISKLMYVFQHTGEWRWPWRLRAPSLCEGLLLCSRGSSIGDSSDAAQRYSGQRKLCLLVPSWAQDSHGWDWTYSPEDPLSKNQWWGCQGICEVEIWVPFHRGRHLSSAV